MELLAHIRTGENGDFENQTLKEHCLATAKYSAEAMKNIGLYNTGYLAGLLHDFGKATNAFNTFLKNSVMGKEQTSSKVIHTFQGAIYLLENYHGGDAYEKITCEILAYAVGSHHGLFDCVDFDGRNGFCYRLDKDKNEISYDEARDNFFKCVCDEEEISKLFNKSVEEIAAKCRSIKTFSPKRSIFDMQFGLLARMVLSAVIEGDRRDTAEFMTNMEIPKNEGNKVLWEKELSYLKRKLDNFDNVTDISKVRKFISDECEAFSYTPQSVCRISVPTGSGKTLATLRFALSYAEKHGKNRIIFIIPLLSILDQNEKVIKDFIGDEKIVFSHHSNVILEDKDEEELKAYELAKDSWNEKIIVSTFVQFMNIFYKNQTSAVRRMNALCESVIVIDEVQSMPSKLVELFNQAINFLTEQCGATVVLSSATQPRNEQTQYPLHIKDGADMVVLSETQKNVFRRCEVVNCVTPFGKSMNEMTEFCGEVIDENLSVLIICNTKKEARNVYKNLKNSLDSAVKLYHLSTSMCQEHRAKVLNDICVGLDAVQKNKSSEKIVCVSTQLVEAGVDFSFQAVIRVLAGFDNLVQSAGRCNRSNEYGYGSKIYLTNLKDENLRFLKDISAAQTASHAVLNRHDKLDLLDEDIIYNYYTEFIKANKFEYCFKSDGIERNMFELLSTNKSLAKDDNRSADYFYHQSFLTAGKQFEVFDDKKIDVIVPYGKDGEKLICDILNDKSKYDLAYFAELVKKAQKYTVSVFAYELKILEDKGLIYTDSERRVLIVKDGAYTDEVGLELDSSGNTENFMI